VTDGDVALVERLRAGRATEAVEADDPDAVAVALEADGARRVPAAEAGRWLAEAEALRSLADAVLAAEEVLARAEAAERTRRALAAPVAADAGPDDGPGAGPDERGAGDLAGPDDDEEEDGPAADRAAVRFALVVLGLAQVGGLAVHAADDMPVAALAPALAIVGVLAVHLSTRGPAAAPVEGAPEPSEPPAAPAAAVVDAPDGDAGDVPPGPVVRAAEAHLRRRRAAWKVAWWERGLAPADVGRWVGPARGDEAPATLVVPDPDGEVGDDAVARIGAAVPAGVRVVVLRGRPA